MCGGGYEWWEFFVGMCMSGQKGSGSVGCTEAMGVVCLSFISMGARWRKGDVAE